MEHWLDSKRLQLNKKYLFTLAWWILLKSGIFFLATFGKSASCNEAFDFTSGGLFDCNRFFYLKLIYLNTMWKAFITQVEVVAPFTDFRGTFGSREDFRFWIAETLLLTEGFLTGLRCGWAWVPDFRFFRIKRVLEATLVKGFFNFGETVTWFGWVASPSGLEVALSGASWGLSAIISDFIWS